MNIYNKSPYQLIQVFRNSSRLQKNYSSKNKKINLEFGLLSLNFKKPELKSKIINEPTNIINIKINDSNEEKESNVLEKSTSNNHKSSKNFLNSDKHKSNNVNRTIFTTNFIIRICSNKIEKALYKFYTFLHTFIVFQTNSGV